MPFVAAIPPLLAAGGGLLARFATNPVVASLLGSMAPGVVSAITGSPTQEEAVARVKPQRDAMLARLIEAGVQQTEAEMLADQAVGSEIERVKAEGGLPEWLVGALSIGGLVGGPKIGSMLRARGIGAAKAAAKAEAGGVAANNAATAGAKASQAASPPPIDRPFVGGSSAADPAVMGRGAYTPPPRPIDPLTGAPRGLSPRTDPLTGAPMEAEAVRPTPITTPFVRSDPYTGGRTYGVEEQQALAAADLRRQRDDAIRRSGMGMASKDDAVRKAEQMQAMRELDEIQRQRGVTFRDVDPDAY